MQKNNTKPSKALILGGNSPRHYDWIRDLGGALQTAGYDTHLHDYSHWQTGVQIADIEHELNRLRTVVGALDDYVIVAKSIGTVITAIGVARGILHPHKCLLLGIPLDGIAGKTAEFTTSLAALPQTTIIQNEYDPYGSSRNVEAHVRAANVPELEFITTPDDRSHDYVNLPLIISALE